MRSLFGGFRKSRDYDGPTLGGKILKIGSKSVEGDAPDTNVLRHDIETCVNAGKPFDITFQLPKLSDQQREQQQQAARKALDEAQAVQKVIAASSARWVSVKSVTIVHRHRFASRLQVHTHALAHTW